MNDLVSQFHRLKLEKENMEKTVSELKNDNSVMNKTVSELKNDNQVMNKTIETLSLTGQSQTNSINRLDLAIHQLNLTDQALMLSDKTMTSQISSVNKSLTSLRDVARVEPNVLFSAILTSYKTLSLNQVLIFDKIVTSEGHGYESHTGIFTTPVDGFYLFHVHLVSGSSNTFNIALQHN